MIYYAADISIQKYFTKSEILQKIENFSMNKNANKYFNLLNANLIENSLLQFLKNDPYMHISGITMPWFYFGMLFSTFCWHTEDLYLYSLNYMHDGSPKIWYSISTKEKEKMDEYIKNKYFAIFLKEPDLIHKLTVHIDPKELIENGINVYRTIQYPGEIILTLPKGYHAGFSSGSNMSEAVNLSVTYIK